MNDVMQLILAGVGIAISLIVTYVPSIADWYYNKVEKKWRGLIMAGFALVVAFSIIGLSCVKLFDFLPCTTTSIIEVIKAWGILLATNQLTYLATPESTFKNK